MAPRAYVALAMTDILEDQDEPAAKKRALSNRQVLAAALITRRMARLNRLRDCCHEEAASQIRDRQNASRTRWPVDLYTSLCESAHQCRDIHRRRLQGVRAPLRGRKCPS